MKNNQKGFSAVEGTLILVIIGLVGFVGWFVYDANKKVDDSLNTANQSNSQTTATKKSSTALTETYTDPAGFTLNYPADWQFAAKGSKDLSGKGEYGFNQFVSKANYQANNNAFILIFSTDESASPANAYAKNVFTDKADRVVSIADSKINGYDAATVTYKIVGEDPSGREVFIAHNGKIVDFVYSNSQADKDYVDTYKAIINSIKFTN
jgi:hypothetical protein